jgi:general secretion pathway protein G
MKWWLIVLLALTVLGCGYTDIISEKDLDPELRVNTQIKLLAMPLATYQLHVGRYPSTDAGLDALLVEPVDVSVDKWRGPYLQMAIPLDPWGNAYYYELVEVRGLGHYRIWSAGPDTIDGTEDDIIETDESLWDDDINESSD